jgi:hypothetical protein
MLFDWEVDKHFGSVEDRLTPLPNLLDICII